MSAAALRPGAVAIPAVGRPRPVRLPTVADHVLPNGLRVLIARRPGIPRFESRLVLPITGDASRLRVLTETVLAGTAELTSREIAERLQGMGGGLGSVADAEQLVIGGSSLSMHASEFLALFGTVLREAAFPPDEVAIERERIVQEIALLRSQPGVIAGDALAARLYGHHPYGRGTPDPDAVARVRAPVLRRLHAERVRPDDGLLVLVGDLDLKRAMADVTAAFGGWAAGGSHPDLPVPSVAVPPSTLVIDRPGAVQTTIRIGGPSIPRTDPVYPALNLAVTVFSGYFTSRLNDNIRERRGFTYGAHSRIEHRRVASEVSISTDVGRDVTAPALVEIAYELGRIVSLPVTQAELDAARRYLQGTLAMGVQTQSGLTSYLSTLVSAGLPVSYLRDYPAALEKVTIDQVLEAARQHLGPTQLTTVLVGDAATIEPTVGPISRLEVGTSS